jgi:hypothetical protein
VQRGTYRVSVPGVTSRDRGRIDAHAASAFPYAAPMPNKKPPGEDSTPSGGSGGPPGKKQRRKLRRNRKASQRR